MSTLQEVIDAYQELRNNVTELDGQLAARWNEIGESAFDAGRDMTDEEKAEQKQITQKQKDLAERLGDLAMENLENLNNADDVTALNDKIANINARLRDDLQGLKDLERYAAAAAKILAGTAKLAEKAAGIVL